MTAAAPVRHWSWQIMSEQQERVSQADVNAPRQTNAVPYGSNQPANLLGSSTMLVHPCHTNHWHDEPHLIRWPLTQSFRRSQCL